MAIFQQVDASLTDNERKIATAAYFGLCSYLDAQIGRVLDSVERAGLTEEIRIVYTSDHGDNVGARGMWGKSNMYEESAGIPLIVAGPGVPAGREVRTPVSLVDAFQTIFDGLNEPLPREAADLPGASWFQLAGAEDESDRAAFSEYHAAGSPSAAFMVRHGRWKYIYYVGFEPELFDLQDDPEEALNLAGDPSHRNIQMDMHALLLGYVDPEEID